MNSIKFKDVSGEVGKLDGKLAEGEKYEGDLKKLKEGENPEKLSTEAEWQLKNVSQLKGVSAELNKAKAMQAEQQAMLQRYYDKKMLQQEITRKAGNVANDLMGQHTQELKSTQAELGKTKRLSSFKSVKKVKDIFRRTSDELDGKKFYQRLVPDMTLQIYNNKTVVVDWATQLGYRVSPRLTTGIGFTYRVGFSDKYQYFMSNQGVYGGRAYLDFVALKGIYAHGEFEYLKLNPQRFAQAGSQELAKPDVYGSYFGLGKKFKISRKIKGSVLGLYRVEYNGTLPSMSKLNVRLGFDYVFRKYKKLTGPTK